MFKTFLAAVAVMLLVAAEANANGVRVRVGGFRQRAAVRVNVGHHVAVNAVVVRPFVRQRIIVQPQAVFVTPQYLVPQHQIIQQYAVPQCVPQSFGIQSFQFQSGFGCQ